jgi:ABC-type amino acid transport system permease subunit
MANEFVTLIKETSILSYVGIVEITREGMLWASRDFKSFPAYVGVAIVYMCMTIPLSRAVAYLEKRMAGSVGVPKHKKRKAGF